MGGSSGGGYRAITEPIGNVFTTAGSAFTKLETNALDAVGLHSVSKLFNKANDKATNTLRDYGLAGSPEHGPGKPEIGPAPTAKELQDQENQKRIAAKRQSQVDNQNNYPGRGGTILTQAPTINYD
jgi:hypothetical protein